MYMNIFQAYSLVYQNQRFVNATYDMHIIKYLWQIIWIVTCHMTKKIDRRPDNLNWDEKLASVLHQFLFK